MLEAMKLDVAVDEGRSRLKESERDARSGDKRREVTQAQDLLVKLERESGQAREEHRQATSRGAVGRRRETRATRQRTF